MIPRDACDSSIHKLCKSLYRYLDELTIDVENTDVHGKFKLAIENRGHITSFWGITAKGYIYIDIIEFYEAFIMRRLIEKEKVINNSPIA